LATNLAGDPSVARSLGAADPSTGAGLVKSVIEGMRDEDVGKIVLADGVQPW
jgi:hypothetical protein